MRLIMCNLLWLCQEKLNGYIETNKTGNEGALCNLLD